MHQTQHCDIKSFGNQDQLQTTTHWHDNHNTGPTTFITATMGQEAFTEEMITNKSYYSPNQSSCCRFKIYKRIKSWRQSEIFQQLFNFLKSHNYRKCEVGCENRC